MRSYPLQPTGGRMCGVDVINTAETPNDGNFGGFGVAVTGSSCYNLNLMSPEDRNAFLKSIYSEDGLGLSVCRLSIGSSDYSAELYTYDDVESDTALEHFPLKETTDILCP